MANQERFWENKALDQLNENEWEQLCDGCAKCCLHKFEYEDTQEVVYTRLACRLLDTDTGVCRNYSNRFKLVPDCVKISAEDLSVLHWLPSSCAYRRLAEGKGLASWHPLVSGDPLSVVRSGNSAVGRVISEDAVPPEDWEEHVVHWVKI